MKKHDEILDELRSEVDEIDAQILQLLSNRTEIVRKIGRFKLDHNLKILDSGRRATVRSNWLKSADSLDLAPDFILSLYQKVHDYSLEIETEQKAKTK